MTSPAHHPGASGGRATDTAAPVAASARPTSRVPTRTVTGTGSPAPEPVTATTTAPSVTLALAIPRLAAGVPQAGASERTLTPPGTSARPVASALRWRSLNTCTSRPGKGSASTSRAARSTVWVRSSRRQSGVALSTPASRASRPPPRTTPSASSSHTRSAGDVRAIDARAVTRRRSSTGRPSTTAPDDGELSRITASAVGSCTPPPSPPLTGTSGRAAANTTATISAVRSTSSSRWRSLRRRALWRSASLK